MKKLAGRMIAGVAGVLFLPALALAQAAIAGVVKDTSGAVLPGVTVEAASPALIEKIRTATTDASGQYRIVDLRPGAYSVTFTLPGFTTVKREGVTLTGSFTASVDVEMRVGALEESVTVTGEAPVVDVQSATRQRVMDTEVIDALPTSRIHSSLAALVPGINSQIKDVGGTTFVGGTMSGHGTRGDDSRIMQGGINVASSRSSAAGGVTTPNLGAMEEVTIDYAGAGAENTTGGVRVNLAPREGGNSFKGSTFMTFASSGMQGNNLTEQLKAQGLPFANSIKDNYDIICPHNRQRRSTRSRAGWS